MNTSVADVIEASQPDAPAEKPGRKKRAATGIKRKPAPSTRAKAAAVSTPAIKRPRKKPATEDESQ
jgi:hypothetical protein